MTGASSDVMRCDSCSAPMLTIYTIDRLILYVCPSWVDWSAAPGAVMSGKLGVIGFRCGAQVEKQLSGISRQMDQVRYESKKEGLARQLELTKLFDRKQCRSCGGKTIPKRVCLDCNEPCIIWCESCFFIEEYLHVGHQELDLF